MVHTKALLDKSSYAGTLFFVKKLLSFEQKGSVCYYYLEKGLSQLRGQYGAYINNEIRDIYRRTLAWVCLKVKNYKTS